MHKYVPIYSCIMSIDMWVHICYNKNIEKNKTAERQKEVIMAVGDVYRLTVILKGPTVDKAVVNTFCFEQGDSLIFDTPGEDLVECWKAFAETPYLEQFTNRLTVFNYKVGKAPDFPTEYQTDEVGLEGNLTGDPMPIRTSAVLAFRTDELSRRGRGRVFLPPANEAANGSDGHPTSGYIDNMKVLGDALLAMGGDTVTTTAHWYLSVWSKASQEHRNVQAYAARNFWGSQRDRKAY